MRQFVSFRITKKIVYHFFFSERVLHSVSNNLTSPRVFHFSFSFKTWTWVSSTSTASPSPSRRRRTSSTTGFLTSSRPAARLVEEVNNPLYLYYTPSYHSLKGWNLLIVLCLLSFNFFQASNTATWPADLGKTWTWSTAASATRVSDQLQTRLAPTTHAPPDGLKDPGVHVPSPAEKLAPDLELCTVRRLFLMGKLVTNLGTKEPC